jgi:DUF4097 and DUF4098 domain-containing protein YvlB
MTTTNGAVMGAVEAFDDLSIKTTNNAISGEFKSSRLLTLKTTNAHISGEVILVNNGGAEASNAMIQTTNGYADSDGVSVL